MVIKKDTHLFFFLISFISFFHILSNPDILFERIGGERETTLWVLRFGD